MCQMQANTQATRPCLVSPQVRLMLHTVQRHSVAGSRKHGGQLASTTTRPKALGHHLVIMSVSLPHRNTRNLAAKVNRAVARISSPYEGKVKKCSGGAKRTLIWFVACNEEPVKTMADSTCRTRL
jgi:hypothetical protein